jgi:hypothetical protein
VYLLRFISRFGCSQPHRNSHILFAPVFREQVTAAIDQSEIGNLGYSFLIGANQEVTMAGPLRRVCSQGLPWGSEPKRLQVTIKPVQAGFEVYADSGPGGESLTPSPKNFVGVGNIGTHVFDDGLVIAWVAKPISSKK